MRKTLLCRTAQLNDARTPFFQISGSHPPLPKPRLFHTNVASTLPRPAKTATTLCQGHPTYLPRPPNLPATHLPISLTRAHPSATHTTRSSRDTRTRPSRLCCPRTRGSNHVLSSCGQDLAGLGSLAAACASFVRIARTWAAAPRWRG